ncbi:hypothetical protein ACFQZC_09055 [Streptacidiphilus monticola]
MNVDESPVLAIQRREHRCEAIISKRMPAESTTGALSSTVLVDGQESGQGAFGRPLSRPRFGSVVTGQG